MDEKPEALRLADVLWPWHEGSTNNLSLAAAELRRLHELNTDKTQIIAALCGNITELLEALKLAVLQNEHDMLMTGEELRICRAAIAKAEGR